MDMKHFRAFTFAWLLIAGFFSGVAGAEDQTWKVNLKDADIRAFITQIADITGYSFVVDPRVKGKVTVVSNAAMGRDEVYEMFLSVLNVHGFAAIPSEGIIKIVQQNEAKQTAENTSIFKTVPQEQLVTRVIQVKNANALELVPILRPMVAKYGHLAGVAAANALIISDHVNNIARIERIVSELDSPSNYQLEVIQLKDAWVGDMVKLLEELAPSELGKGAPKGPANKFSVVADERSNRLILKGDENFRDKMRLLIAKLDQPAAVSGTTKVINLRHADAEALAELLKGLMGDIAPAKGEGAAAAPGGGKVSIYPDEGLNALVVRAEPSMMKEIEAIVQQLDVRRAQVLIEAAIVEISDGLSRQLGVQMAAGDLTGKSGPATVTNFTNVGISASAILAAIASNSTPSIGGDIAAVAIGEADGKKGWGALIQALGTSGQANLLSTPSIITMDNLQSEIIVGQNVPFRTGQTGTGTDGTSNPFTTIERQDVGLTLRVTPSISDGDLVRLEIEQETSSIAPSNESASDIITNKRQIKTSVLADNAETIVLGGLMSENYKLSEAKVPLLGDIPLLGALFRSTKREKDKQNLLVFLRPTILRNKEEAKKASQDKYDQLWELNLSIKRDHKGDKHAETMIKPSMDSVYRENAFEQ
ncbi:MULTISPECIES: type II secretion system secretin GspD [unclassified Hahella]|uniref:type II secretion system secretin GspD n=1 Tax=unclassified Hahella TaxID=2624107 RepID=UPI000FDDF6F0|nr:MULTISPECIES: type II secretion system secretin GspD [unclassified Hahella]AZZ91474.1 type II secretion system protein GspD [Hahella sp. KA22]MDG9667531.1 type II secretion system secretin GspD [Hahella sp. CR1]QAY54843.1 type II secretion system protein GspD [Hahella sp. KA22]